MISTLEDLLTDRWGTTDHKNRRPLAAQDTTRLLLQIGNLVCGWLLLRSAQIAEERTNTATPADRDFYLGKAATGRWFARHVIATIPAELASMQHTSSDLVELPHTAF